MHILQKYIILLKCYPRMVTPKGSCNHFTYNGSYSEIITLEKRKFLHILSY